MKTVWILTLLALAAVGLSGCNLFGNNGCGQPQCSINGVNGAQRYATRPAVVDGTHLEAAPAPAR
jgi:hypothetical protein